MQPKSPPNPIRRKLLTSITSLLGFVGVVFAAIPFLSAFKPSARAEAAGAPVKVNISKLSPGELMTVEWRGMPVFVYKVSSEAQNVLSADKSKLADPNSDQQQQPEYAQNDTRSRKKGIAVVKGVCTHFRSLESIMIVTGPSLIKLTFISAPNLPDWISFLVFTLSASRKELYNGIA